MSKMIKVDLINIDDPNIGFNGEVKAEGFQERVNQRKTIIMHMPFGNQMIVSPYMQLKYTFIVLGKEEMQRRDDVVAKEG